MMRQYQQSDISKFRVTVERILYLHLIISLDCVILLYLILHRLHY